MIFADLCVVSVSIVWRAEFSFHVEYYELCYKEIEYVATSFSPARTDLALKLLTTATNPAAQQSMVLSTQNGMSYPHSEIMSQSVHRPNQVSDWTLTLA